MRYSEEELDSRIAALRDQLDKETNKDKQNQISKSIDQGTAELKELRDSNAKRIEVDTAATLKDRDAKLAQILESEKQVNAQISGSSAVLEYNSILIRVAAVLLIVFLVQTFVTIFRYITRLAAYYQGRVDSLHIASDTEISVSDLQQLATLFPPEAYDFGKLPRTPTEQAVDLARTILATQRKEKDE